MLLFMQDMHPVPARGAMPPAAAAGILIVLCVSGIKGLLVASSYEHAALPYFMSQFSVICPSQR